MTDTGAFLRVGELAEASGLTIRALHHYEHVGLVTPTTRTDSGHRLYGPEAVARLYSLVRLRQLGLSLTQVRRVLDDPDQSLARALRQHLDGVDTQLADLRELRSGVSAALVELETDSNPSRDLLKVLTTMDYLASPIRRRISIMVYHDVRAAHDHLVEVFGFAPGEVTIDPDGQAVHAEVFVGDGVVWLHPESEEHHLASPSTLGAASSSMAVLVDDVDEHFQMVTANGGTVVYEPVDQPYGYREYSARDGEGALWSFMKPIGP